VRVVLTGGGTGGHIYPALSVARCLAGEEILYVGTADGPEASIVPQSGVPFRSVPSRKLSRKPTPGALVALGVSAWGVVKAAAMLRGWRPDVVLGTGGYASAGIMFAAAMLRIPTVVHEANVVPGRVNRLLAKLCTRVALTYEASVPYFPAGKTVVTGLPVRPDLLEADPERGRDLYGLRADLPVLVISGGSGGARTLNRAVIEALPRLRELGVQVAHQTGRGLHDEVMREVGPPPELYHPLAYVDDMPALLAAASVIVCRGGSSTLAEVTAAGLPSVIVPYPFAVADHQTHNAKALADQGAAVMVPDAAMNGDRLFAEVSGLLQAPARMEAMRAASRAQGRPEAARKVADLLREIARHPGVQRSTTASIA
jgi:UDP-N-acetylglucosamine--N-acetylmuramyl-(pentapeptide) pyrophosphoryl-undecaprenol N-acetylglucosamine transferase